MYLVVLKTALVNALEKTFDSEYPEVDFRNVKVGIEYPMDQSSYPGLWINYDDTEPLTTAGIDHREYFLDPDLGTTHEVTRWRFGGTITITCVALTSLERDRLFDEVVRIFAFSRESQAVGEFRDLVENNDLVAMNINFDDLNPSGDNVAQGTPWMTDEFIYEKSLSMDCIGEFVSRPGSRALVPLSAVEFIGYPEGDGDEPYPSDDRSQPYQRTDWQ